ncbi:pantothenate kinase type III, CoaX-like [Bacillus sp. JCM 19046]|nr:pantothenate kinase type III, CoaX-like [Bacillus sp. JCM 19045]GAF17670.1 pantothenate kinase type III, CoaX-like [Bacillus sp. JCM 19046]
MFLAIDIGNSSIVTGIFENEQRTDIFRIATTPSKTSDEYAMVLHGFFQFKGYSFAGVAGVVISSVVPTIMHRFRKMCRDYFQLEPVIVGPGVKTGLNIQYDNPREVGADRISNAVAALALYGAPCIVVDIGTATTFCYIDDQYRYRGGAIAPGAALAAEALTAKASKLPQVELERPESIIGKTTLASIHSGTYYGYLSMIDGMIGRIKKEQKQPNVRVIATGGLVQLYAGESEQIDFVEPELTLKGLKLIYDKNKQF